MLSGPIYISKIIYIELVWFTVAFNPFTTEARFYVLNAMAFSIHHVYQKQTIY